MTCTSELIIAKDNLSADYELKVEAEATEGTVKGSKVSVTHKYPVTKVVDDKGYFHIRKASDLIVDDIFDRLSKEINKSL